MHWPRIFRARRTRRPDPTVIDAIVDENVALAERFDARTRQRLLDVTATLIEEKRWEVIGNLHLTDEVLVTVAANAAIPVLKLDPELVYRSVQSIIIRPSSNVLTGTRAGPARGVVSDEPMHVVGQAAPRSGPVSIAWETALAESRAPRGARNVVIHEFAHKIDMSDGYIDGAPALRGAALVQWTEMLDDEYQRAEARPSDSALRPYAWTNRGEFFAVTTETFFCTPDTLRNAKPALYQALAGFYLQDPAAPSNP